MAGNPHIEQLHQAHMRVKQQQHEQQIALMHHEHQAKLAQGYVHAAKQAIDAHRTYGPEGLKAMLQEYMHNGGKPDFLRNVGTVLQHGGRPDLAQLHAEAADAW
jgi:hypothetical protein